MPCFEVLSSLLPIHVVCHHAARTQSKGGQYVVNELLHVIIVSKYLETRMYTWFSVVTCQGRKEIRIQGDTTVS